jgi:biotin carboxyl carrier protein
LSDPISTPTTTTTTPTTRTPTEPALIPTPVPLKIKRVRYQVLPGVIFVFAIFMTVFLWKGYAGSTHGTGEVSAIAIHISAPRAGRLIDAPGYPRLYDHVEKGQGIARISSGLKSSELKAPFGGMVTSIKHRPGEFVKSGQEIMTVTQDGGAYIVSYIRPGSSIIPRKDMKVSVRGQDHHTWAETRVQEVGSHAVLIPDQQLSNAKKPEWGIPVRIEMPETLDLPLRPGEIVLLNFRNTEEK